LGLQPNRALTKSEYVYELLRERAKRGQLRPQRRLRPADLDAEFRGGLTPARDALLRLQAEGYIRSDAGRGYWTKLYRAKEQRDLQTMLLMCVVYCADAAGRREAAGLQVTLNQYREATAATLEGASEGLPAARVEAQDLLFRQLGDLSGNEIFPKLIGNAVDRTYFPRVLDAEDAAAAHRVASHIAAICDASLMFNREAAAAAAMLLSKEWSDRLDAIIERANAVIAREKFP
jgi:DNA-binding GntR family transcriptional regulator